MAWVRTDWLGQVVEGLLGQRGPARARVDGGRWPVDGGRWVFALCVRELAAIRTGLNDDSEKKDKQRAMPCALLGRKMADKARCVFAAGSVENVDG